MSLTLGAYHDPGLTNPARMLTLLQRIDGSSGPADFRLFIGSQSTGQSIRAASNPGVDPIVLSVSANGVQSAASVTLAATQAALATATPGASLDLGPVIAGGASNALEIWVRVVATTYTQGTDSGLKLITNDLDGVA